MSAILGILALCFTLLYDSQSKTLRDVGEIKTSIALIEQKMTADDFRGLSPLIYNHINPYGIFELDMSQRLPLEIQLAA